MRHQPLYQYGDADHYSDLYWDFMYSHYPEAVGLYKPIHVFIVGHGPLLFDPFNKVSYFPVNRG